MDKLIKSLNSIKEYTENQTQIFSRAECPDISHTFNKIAETLNQFESIIRRSPLTPETINIYNNKLHDLEIQYKRLSFYGPDFTERTKRYQKFKSDIELQITQTIYQYRQSSNLI